MTFHQARHCKVQPRGSRWLSAKCSTNCCVVSSASKDPLERQRCQYPRRFCLPLGRSHTANDGRELSTLSPDGVTSLGQKLGLSHGKTAVICWLFATARLFSTVKNPSNGFLDRNAFQNAKLREPFSPWGTFDSCVISDANLLRPSQG